MRTTHPVTSTDGSRVVEVAWCDRPGDEWLAVTVRADEMKDKAGDDDVVYDVSVEEPMGTPGHAAVIADFVKVALRAQLERPDIAAEVIDAPVAVFLKGRQGGGVRSRVRACEKVVDRHDRSEVPRPDLATGGTPRCASSLRIA